MSRKHKEIKDNMSAADHLKKLLIAEHNISIACQEYMTRNRQETNKTQECCTQQVSFNNYETEVMPSTCRNVIKLRKISPLFIKENNNRINNEKLKPKNGINSVVCWDQKKSQSFFLNQRSNAKKRCTSVTRNPSNIVKNEYTDSPDSDRPRAVFRGLKRKNMNKTMMNNLFENNNIIEKSMDFSKTEHDIVLNLKVFTPYSVQPGQQMILLKGKKFENMKNADAKLKMKGKMKIRVQSVLKKKI